MMPAALLDHLDDAAFARLMAAQGEVGSRLAVAVSGGPDSLALLHVLARWTAGADKRLTAVTIDHGLRADASEEAAFVARRCRALGVAHRTLSWSGEKPKTGLQEAARRARYRLLHEFCLLEGASDLFLAHHAEDQAETFLLRLLGRSGYEGLAAMPAVGALGSIRLRRPLLGVKKAALSSALAEEGLEWREDPSNRDRRFLRVRLRAAQPALDEAGLSCEAAWAAALSFGRLRRRSDHLIARLAAEAARVDPMGFARLDQAGLIEAGDLMGPRLLSRLLQGLGGQRHPPRPEAVEALWRRLPLARGVTLAGCRLTPASQGLAVTREPARVAAQPLRPGRAYFWDRRYEVVCGTQAPAGLALAPLGETGVAAARALPGGAAALEAMPGPARAGAPGLWRDGALLCHLSFDCEGRANPDVGLRIRFIPPQLSFDASFTVAEP